MQEKSQPPIKGGRELGSTLFHSGGLRSRARLEQLRFDPIGELVAKYRELEKEVELQENIRDGKIVQMTNAGKPRAYRPEVHHALYDKLISIAEKLLRYNYGRVPEVEELKKRAPAALVVQLTQAGETYSIGDALPQGHMSDPDEGEFNDD